MASLDDDRIPETMTAGRMRHVIGALLADCGVPSPSLEADRVICCATGAGRAELHAHPERVLGRENFARTIELAVRRAGGEPMAYLAGSSFFCGRLYRVDRRVLIPRPETESLVAAASLAMSNVGENGTFADWCTGSGCIAIELLIAHPGWRAYAVDASRDALAVAQMNARRYGVADRLTLVECSHPDDASTIIAPASLDMVTANPPYIPTRAIDGLETQVRDFEPRIALDGGAGGVSVLFMLAESLPVYVKDGCAILFETGGAEQLDALERFLSKRIQPPSAKMESRLIDHVGVERFAELRVSR